MRIFSSSAVCCPMVICLIFSRYRIIASSKVLLPIRSDSLMTIPLRLSTATSVVPPPISTTMEPLELATSRPAPIAAASGSSITTVLRAPACIAASMTARFSTFVAPEGTQIIIRGLKSRDLPIARRIKYRSIYSVAS